MKHVHILLVEDNEGDILLTKEAIEEANLPVNLSIVKDGKQAMDFLTQANGYHGVKLPALVLLDINLPKKNGHEVLEFIKTNENLRRIPVIMLTTSSTQNDINLSYNNYANCFITKPVDANDFMGVVNTIESFWLTTVKLPSKKETRYEKR